MRGTCRWGKNALREGLACLVGKSIIILIGFGRFSIFVSRLGVMDFVLMASLEGQLVNEAQDKCDDKSKNDATDGEFDKKHHPAVQGTGRRNLSGFFGNTAQLIH